jgi:hypothetical protein
MRRRDVQRMQLNLVEGNEPHNLPICLCGDDLSRESPPAFVCFVPRNSAAKIAPYAAVADAAWTSMIPGRSFAPARRRVIGSVTS